MTNDHDDILAGDVKQPVVRRDGFRHFQIDSADLIHMAIDESLTTGPDAQGRRLMIMRPLPCDRE